MWGDGIGGDPQPQSWRKIPFPTLEQCFFSLLPNPGEMSSNPKLIPPPWALIQAEAQGCQQGVWSS